MFKCGYNIFNILYTVRSVYIYINHGKFVTEKVEKPLGKTWEKHPFRNFIIYKL